MKKEEGKLVVAVKNADIKTYRERSLYIGTKKGMKGALKVVKKGLEKMIEKQTTEHPALADSEERGWHNRCITIYSTDNGILIKPELIKADIGTTIKDVEYTLSMQVGEVLTGSIFEETDVVSEGDEYPELSKKVEEIATPKEDDKLKLLKETNEKLDEYAQENIIDKDDPTGEIYGDAYEAQRLQEEAEDEAYVTRFVKGPFHSADIRYSAVEFTPGYFWHDIAANLPIDRSHPFINGPELAERIIKNSCEYYESDTVTRQCLLRIIKNDYEIVPVSYIINVAKQVAICNHPLVKPDDDKDLPSMNDIYKFDELAAKYEAVIRKSLTRPGKYTKYSSKWNWGFFDTIANTDSVECEFLIALDYVLICMVARSKDCVGKVVDSISKLSPDIDAATADLTKSNCKSIFDVFNVQYSAGNVYGDMFNKDCYGYREIYQPYTMIKIKLGDIPAGYYFVTANEYQEYLNIRNADESDICYGATLPIYYTKYNGKMLGGGHKSPYHIYSPSRTMMDYYSGTDTTTSINKLLTSTEKEFRDLGRKSINDLKNDIECYLIAETAFVLDAGGDNNE